MKSISLFNLMQDLLKEHFLDTGLPYSSLGVEKVIYYFKQEVLVMSGGTLVVTPILEFLPDEKVLRIVDFQVTSNLVELRPIKPITKITTKNGQIDPLTYLE